jgi:hypothetical protein
MAALSMVGCFDPDVAVYVDATVSAPSAAVEMSGLVAAMSGSLQLDMHLGPRAEGASTVSLQSLSVTNADRTTTLLDVFAATPEPQFPLEVGVNSDVGVTFTATAADNQLEPEARDELCGAGGLVYVVVLDDSLRGGSVTAASEVFTPTCP